MKHINVLVLVSIILLCSCSQAPITRTLHRAEQLMTEAPDSAEKILNAIPRQNLKSRAHKARFALLYSQAMDKCYIDTDNDSLISVAVKYYSKQGSDHEKAMAYYYESVVYRNAKNTDAQVASLVKAQKYAENTEDPFLKGLIYSKLGQLYYAQFQFSKSKELFRKAADAFDQVNSLKNKMISLANLSNALYHLNQEDEYIAVTTEARNIAEALNENTFATSLGNDLITATNKWNRDEILCSKRALFVNKDNYSKGEFARRLSNYYEREGNIDSTKYYLIEYIKNDEVRTFLYCGGIARLSRLYEDQGDIAEALKYERMYVTIKDSLYKVEKNSIIEELEHKYKNKEITLEKVSLQKRNTLLIIISLLSVVILIALIIHIINHHKSSAAKQKAEYESYITQYDTQYKNLQEQYETLSKNVGAYTNDKGEVCVKLIEALNNRLSSLRKLSELAYVYGETSPQKFYHKFQEHIIITKNRNDEFINEVIEVSDILNGGIIEYLMKNYPDLSKYELSYCGLVSLGFTPESIRVLYNHTNLHSLYTIRARIKNKVSINGFKVDNNSLEDYIYDLCNKLKNK